ncbi:MAG: cellulase family glycosylhydrolase, partial [Anaerolineales bacterium]|nr:cellulase family glycosylhydrolase [Anaerolineales bacterium]
TPAFPVYDGPLLDRSQIGLQLHLHNEDIDEMMRQLETLNVGWVKVQVSWKLFQPEPGRLDDVLWQELDDLVAAANERDIQVLLGVAKAPEWSRPTTEMDGPPSDGATFARFMGLLSSRYAGRVAAYELWNETNLQREWNGAPLSGADLAELIRLGAQAVRENDPQALVITGAPAPTGINDGVTAVDDRVYFQQLVEAGVAQWVDGFGVHPYGWANPPLSRFTEPDTAVETHADHPSFFFRDTLADYRQILTQASIDKPLWATEFGWGSYENIADPVPGTEYMLNVTEWQQAEYTLGAYAFIHDATATAPNEFGPFILWNLNFGPLLGTEFSESAYSILRPDGSPRPIYHALQTLTQRPD